MLAREAAGLLCQNLYAKPFARPISAVMTNAGRQCKHSLGFEKSARAMPMRLNTFET